MTVKGYASVNQVFQTYQGDSKIAEITSMWPGTAVKHEAGHGGRENDPGKKSSPSHKTGSSDSSAMTRNAGEGSAAAKSVNLE
jgi:hypothetical protein